MPKILIVDDDDLLAQLISVSLTNQNYNVELAKTAGDAKDKLQISEFDLLILDWMLPDSTGLELCRWYRKHGKSLVLMLTSKASDTDKEEGLDAGADDYLTKPFSMKELCARVRALLRRPATLVAELTAGKYKLHLSTLTVEGESTVQLAPREFHLLEFLARHPNEIFSADALIMRVWPSDTEATVDSLRTCIKQIRKKLNDDGIVETVYGAGYKLGASKPR